MMHPLLVMPGLSRHPGSRTLSPVRERQPCVYILASDRNGTLYVGVTSNLVGRMMQHREGTFYGFTSRYGVIRLVWFEMTDTMEAAITAEKRIKKWPRAYKLNLIEAGNPRWRDLAVDLGLPSLDDAWQRNVGARDSGCRDEPGMTVGGEVS